MRISFILTLKNRQKYLIKCLDSLQKQINKNFELIICDYESKDINFAEIIDRFSFSIIIIKGKPPFARAEGLNLGFNFAQYTKLFFTDPDMIFPLNFVDLALQNIQPKQAWFPICKNEESNYNADKDGWRINGYGNCGFMRKDFIFIDKWPVSIKAWGGEDYLMKWKCELEKIRIIRNKVPNFIHQDHEHSYISTDYDDINNNIKMAKEIYLQYKQKR